MNFSEMKPSLKAMTVRPGFKCWLLTSGWELLDFIGSSMGIQQGLKNGLLNERTHMKHCINNHPLQTTCSNSGFQAPGLPNP